MSAGRGSSRRIASNPSARPRAKSPAIRFNADWLRRLCDEHAELGYVVLRRLLAVVARPLTATRYDSRQPTFDGAY